MSFATDLAALAVGAWLKAPVQTGSKIQDVFVSPAPTGTQSAVTSAWGGACFDSTRKDIIIHGGGHNDYSGNEGYAFQIGGVNDTDFVWRVKWKNSTERSADTDIRYADGTPPAAHTYTCLIYNPARDTIQRLPGLAPYTTAAAFNSVHADELDASVESPSAAVPTYWTAQTDDVGGSYGVWAYNPNDGNFWGTSSDGTGSVRNFDPVANLHNQFSNFDSGVAVNPRNMTAAIAPTGVGYFAYLGTALQIKKLDDYTFAGTSDTNYGASGDTAIQTPSAPGFVWDALVNQFVAWAGLQAGGTDRRDWYTLPDPATANKVWTRHVGTGDIPPAPVTNGTYSRFLYVGDGLCALVNDTATEVYFLRCSGPVSCAVTGTATANITEADVVAGGKTIILTMTNDTWIS